MTMPHHPQPQPMPLENALHLVSEVCGAFMGNRAQHQQIDAALGSILGTLQANQSELLAARQRIAELEKAVEKPEAEDRSETLGMTTQE